MHTFVSIYQKTNSLHLFTLRVMQHDVCVAISATAERLLNKGMITM